MEIETKISVNPLIHSVQQILGNPRLTAFNGSKDGYVIMGICDEVTAKWDIFSADKILKALGVYFALCLAEGQPSFISRSIE